MPTRRTPRRRQVESPCWPVSLVTKNARESARLTQEPSSLNDTLSTNSCPPASARERFSHQPSVLSGQQPFSTYLYHSIDTDHDPKIAEPESIEQPSSRSALPALKFLVDSTTGPGVGELQRGRSGAFSRGCFTPSLGRIHSIGNMVPNVSRLGKRMVEPKEHSCNSENSQTPTQEDLWKREKLRRERAKEDKYRNTNGSRTGRTKNSTSPSADLSATNPSQRPARPESSFTDPRAVVH